MATQPTKEIVLSGYKHRYVEAGSGNKTLLLVHGVSSSLDIFDKVVPALSKNRRVLALDLLGFGESDKPANHDYTLQFYSNLLLEFLQKTDSLGKGKEVYALGHSMGGKYVITLAIENTGVVDRLILSNTDGFINIPPVIRAASVWGARHLLEKIVMHKAFVRRAMRTVYYDPSHITEEHFEHNLRMIRDKATFNTIMLLNRNYKKLDLKRMGIRDRLWELKIPTLIIWGDYDKFISPKCAQSAKDEIPNSTLKIIPKCGHAPMMEKSKEFISHIEDFLKSHGDSG
ncbi:MAG: alpha/beta hydrolase [Chlorobiales bacterium]|nr:alpha/beta hydrolase [Chlorobiales bacterium]